MTSLVPPSAHDRLIAAVPWLIAGATFLALAAFVGLDPARDVTASRSPFSDEAWSVMNARNQVLFGRWATDGWQLYLVSLPFAAVQALVFTVFGVGMVEARLVSVAAIAAAAGALAIGLRRPFGWIPAAVAAVAFATSLLVLFYGRLALLEPLVTLLLTVGVLTLDRAKEPRALRWGLVGGLAFGLAIGSKPNAAFAILGILLAVAALGLRWDRGVRKWLAGVVSTVAALGLTWLALIGLPRQADVLADVRIWPAQQLPSSLAALVRAVVRYPFRSDGAVTAAAPLAVGGLLGAAASVLGWRDLGGGGRRLVAAAVGWLIAGSIPLFVLDYHPNRYVVPLLPALAILLAAGLATAGRRLGPRLSGRGRAIAIALIVVLMSAPGTLAYIGWVNRGTQILPAAQAVFERTLPSGTTVEGGLAPLFAMRAPVITIVPWARAGVNAGDEYATRGVRWVVVDHEGPPSWVALHPQEWAARERVFCTAWGSEDVCLYRLR